MKNGFTLIELLVAVAITAIVSVIAVNLLFRTVLTRARQNSIQASSEDIRSFIGNLSNSVREAGSVTVLSSTELKTESATICQIYKLTGNSLYLAEDATGACNPTVFNQITDYGTIINQPGGTVPNIFSPIGNTKSVDVAISGKHKDSFGQHDFSYSTKIIKRI